MKIPALGSLLKSGPSALLGLLTVAMGLGGGVCHGQSATVVFQVEMPDREVRKGLRVRAIQKSPGTRSKTQELIKKDYNYVKHEYSHKIDRLPPGTYDFVFCDGREYRPAVQKGTVQAGQVLTISFLPEDQDKGDQKMANVLPGPEGRPSGVGFQVFLRDIATGCRVAEATTDQDGKYEFAGLPPKTKYEVSLEEADRDP
jgi:hypothetical protein